MNKDKHIPQGYKGSPLGIIPKEWEVKRLGDYVDIISGESPSLYDLRTTGTYPYVKVEDMNNCTKYQIESREYSNSQRNIVPKGSIIFPKRGAAILNNKVRIAYQDILMDSNMMAITPKTQGVDSEFLYYTIIKEQLYKIADTSTIPQINNKHILPYRFCFPPIEQQKKICSVLQLWDTAIEKQSELIDKLKLRKRALMQQLLTGKKRLPGFSGEWKRIKLGDIAERITRKNEEDNKNVVTISAQRGFVVQTDFFNKSVAASYNAGPGAISSRMEAQKEKRAADLWLLNETSRYMFRVLAAKMLFEDPAEFGFNVPEEDRYPVIGVKEVVEVSDPIEDLTAFAKEHGVSFAQLKRANLWLRESKLNNNSHRNYEIIIPRDPGRP